jgi:hypothetical protein
MSLRKFSQSSLSKSALLFLFVASTFLLGGTRAEAASTSWSVPGYPTSFSASTDATNYLPGGAVTVTLTGWRNDPSGRVTIGVYAALGAGLIGQCQWADNYTSTLTAPTAPGLFNIAVYGTWSDCSIGVAAANGELGSSVLSGMSVVCPSGTVSNGSSCVVATPSVNIIFSFLDKVVKFISGTV